MRLGEWVLYIRSRDAALGGWYWSPLGSATPLTQGRRLWMPIKVTRESRRPGWRNNYHVYFSLTERRLADNTDLGLMRTREPDLAAMIEGELDRIVRESGW